MDFQYSVIRVVPSMVAEECLNVAVMIKHSTGHVELNRVGRLDRVARAFPGIDRDAVELSLAHFDELRQTEPDLDLWALSRSTQGALVQVSPPATTIGANIQSELRELFQVFVEPGAARSATYANKKRAVRRGVTSGT